MNKDLFNLCKRWINTLKLDELDIQTPKTVLSRSTLGLKKLFYHWNGKRLSRKLNGKNRGKKGRRRIRN